MNQSIAPQILFLSTSLLSSAFTMDTTSSMTVTGHGWRIDDKIRMSSVTTLPAGLSASTDYYVVKIVDANTVQISATLSGEAITTTDAGTGTHTAVLKSRYIFSDRFTDMTMSWHTANSANFTAKLQKSDQSDINFENASTATNRWTYVQTIDNDDGSAVDGSTGITQDTPGTDENKSFSINLDRNTWYCLDITTWTAGTLDSRISLSTR